MTDVQDERELEKNVFFCRLKKGLLISNIKVSFKKMFVMKFGVINYIIIKYRKKL